MERTNLLDDSRKSNAKKWRDDYVKWGYRLALLGLTNREMAKALDVAEDTFDRWIKSKPDFSDAVWRGKVLADAKVAAAVYKSIIGYKVKKVKITPYRGEVVKTPYEEEVGPNGEVGLKWLNIRQRDRWAVRTESLNTHINIDKMVFSELSDDELKAIQKVTMTHLIPLTGEN